MGLFNLFGSSKKGRRKYKKSKKQSLKEAKRAWMNAPGKHNNSKRAQDWRRSWID